MTTSTSSTAIVHNRRGRQAAAAALAITVGMFLPGGTSAHAQTTAAPAASGYDGPAPVWGGDPVIGETEDSYFARTGDHLPGSTSAYGGDPVTGETDESYFARTGDHLRGQ
jgi:hypothetical protein